MIFAKAILAKMRIFGLGYFGMDKMISANFSKIMEKVKIGKYCTESKIRNWMLLY